ncbi:uncharacterized protein SAPINGB_P000329 [Magnusiomyces paraingens]|uniref:Protein CMS1 n=1 Tax=Magnusiomyces paraingens TaxID=2606893 RepID=A0A5E8AYX2_9ASCO|nr:uncharacterized protein SAPINGB_P000329 [Saprochaete ingens]VVT44176.1 unnamed protein product [Saprochaete ingens]
MTTTAADDLNDGLDYAFDGTLSDGDNNGSNSDEGAVFLDDEIYYGESGDGPSSSKKRGAPESNTSDASQQPASKKAKKKNNKNKGPSKSSRKEQGETIAAQKSGLARRSDVPALVADFLSSALRHRHKDLSAVEVADMSIPESRIAETGEIAFPGDRDLEEYGRFFEQFFGSVFEANRKVWGDNKDDKKKDDKKKDDKKKDDKKSKKDDKKKDEKKDTKNKQKLKYIVVLASSAKRVCDVNRALRKTPGGSFKLIAKNAPEYDARMFATARSCVAVATVGRLQRALDAGYLEASQIAAIVADSTYLDPKAQHVWDLPETIPFVRKLLDETDPETKLYLY